MRRGNIDPLPAPKGAGSPCGLVRGGKGLQSHHQYLDYCPILELKENGSET